MRALLPQPKLLIADEPFQGLSPRSADFLLSLLVDLHNGGSTLVLASADASRWAAIPGVSIVVLSGAKLKAVDSTRAYESEAIL